MSDVRIATIGRSGIADRMIDAIEHTDGVTLAACYSRSLDDARAYADAHGAGLAFDDLGELASCPDVDAVYVASPNGLHAEQASRLISGGRHVLVEKAFAANEAQARRVFELAHEHGVVCMEAMRPVHMPAHRKIRELIPTLGEVRLATVRFSKVTSRVARVHAGERVPIFDPRLCAGALMDIGVYCVEPAVSLFGRPDRVIAACVTGEVPGTPADDPCRTIDYAGEVLLDYGSKVVSLSYGKMSDDELPSQIAGEQATITWGPTSGPLDVMVYRHIDTGMVFKIEKGEGAAIHCEAPDNDMCCELADFVAAVRGDEGALALVADCERTTIDSLHVMDEVRAQAGVRFPVDDQ